MALSPFGKLIIGTTALALTGCMGTEMSEHDKEFAEAIAAEEKKWEHCVASRRVAATEWESCLNKERARPSEERNFDACGPKPFGPERCGMSPMEKAERAMESSLRWNRRLMSPRVW